MNQAVKLAAAGFAALTIFAGCTKERPYKAVPKPELGVIQHPKPIVDVQSDYLMVASTLESSRRSSASRPFWMGNGDRVRFVFTEKALKVIAPEKDGRFSDNPTNANAVLSIPIVHLDYKCAEDDFGDCTHKEEENNEVRWDKKNFFMLKPEEMAAQQVSVLPVEISNFFSMGLCYKEVGSEFIHVKMEKDAINLIVEKTFQGSAACVNWVELEDLADLTFKVRYQYSFAKLSTLATPGYKTVQYTRADENNFGFFATDRHELDVDNNDTVDSRSMIFDRWAPDRQVTYYLSEAFAKPENAILKKATQEAFTQINNSLAKAGTKLRLDLRDPVPGMSPGDIRNNTIVLVEDPQAIGVIGYGPHATNPLTGEIVHARTVMYLGTIKKYIKVSYDEIVKEKLAQLNTSKVKVAKLTLSPALDKSARMPAKAQVSNASTGTSLLSASVKPGDILPGGINLEKLREFAVNPERHAVFARNLKEKVEMISRHLGYPGDNFNFAAAIDGEIDQVLEEVGLKPWEQLSAAEKNRVLAALLPHVYIPTLVHELGHNLGLRHNFAGSEDKANFYSKEELKEMGFTGRFDYSSIMDYAYKTTNELRTMGKYDIAALRYGYAEKVELADGKMVTLDELRANPEFQLKQYSYCTDEHVDANPNCNRFDEGTNMLEIAQHYVRAYEERYKRANFRNGRGRFSSMRESGQLAAIDDTMFNLRLMFERYEAIKNTFDLDDNRPEWQSEEFLRDTRAAAATAGQFFLNVLKTPDLMCAVAEAKNPTMIVAILPIRAITKREISCFDIQLNDQFLMVAEAGKSFQSRKDPNANHPLASFADQIDVRGIYMDKILATHYLFGRYLGSTLFDNYTENFLHMPELQRPILETLQQVITDDFVAPTTFRIAGGGEVDFTIAYKLYDAEERNNSHSVPSLLDDTAREVLGLPTGNATFHHEFVKNLMAKMPSNSHQEIATAILGQFRVRSFLPNDGRPQDYAFVEIGPERYFTLKGNTAAAELFNSLTIVNLLSQLTAEQLEKVLKTEKVEELSAIEQQAKALGNEAVQRFVDGGFQTAPYYTLMIRSLASM